MTDDEYIAKLKSIRKERGDAHRAFVERYPIRNSREDIPKIISLYDQIEALDRMIAAEEARQG